MLEDLVGCVGNGMSDNDLRQYVQKHLAIRYFALWHDHSTVCGCEYILVTCKEVYNSSIHYTNAEYEALTGQTLNIQAAVERPYIHILAAGSSSAADTIALAADRVDCLKQRNTALYTEEGTEITDVLRFFNGDKVAQWIEGGCQLGGNYKCASCGVEASSFSDSARCNQVRYRSIEDIQAHVIAGVHGAKKLCVKPFAIRQELAARKLNSGGEAKVVRQCLVEHLGGLQRVPLLLITNPKGNLEALHLQHYCIMDFEPLHGIKGHLINLFAELPHILPSHLKVILANCLAHAYERRRSLELT